MTEVEYFYADWCEPCKLFGPMLDRVAAEMNIKVNKHDIDQPDVQIKALSYGVQSIPYLGLSAYHDLVGGTTDENTLRSYLSGAQYANEIMHELTA